MNKFFFFFLLLFFFSPLVFAVGVSPPSYTLDFEPNSVKTFDFKVRNNAGMDLYISPSLSGNLVEYASFDNEQVFMKSGESTIFKLILSFPKEIDTPGYNKLRIMFKEEKPGGGIVASTAVISGVLVFVPYPGKYAEIQSFVVADGNGGVNEGEATPVAFTLWSRGKEIIRNSRAEVSLFDDNNTLIDKIVFNNIIIPAEGKYSQDFEFMTSDLAAADYLAVLNYSYDDVVRTAKNNFRVGNFDVDIISYPKQIEKKGIVEFPLIVQSRWKGGVEVSAQVSAEGSKAMKTSAETLGNFAKKTLQAYVDTSALVLGNHTVDVTLTFKNLASDDGETLSKTVSLSVEVIEPLGAEKERASFSSTTLVFVGGMLLALLIATIILFTLLMKKKK